MNKKLIIISVLVLLVSLLLVLGQDSPENECTYDNPCTIPSDRVIELERGRYYTFEGYEGDPILSSGRGRYFYNPTTTRIEPVVELGNWHQWMVMDASGIIFNIAFPGGNSPTNPATSTGTSPPGERTISIGGIDYSLTEPTAARFQTDCQANLDQCSIQGINRYTTSTEQVTVRDDTTIRRNTATGTVTIGEDFIITAENYAALSFDPATTDGFTFDDNTDTITLTSSGNTQTIRNTGWGLGVTENGRTSYLVGGERITQNADNSWEYDGNRYDFFNPALGTLSDGSDTIQFGNDGAGNPQITETDSDGTTITTTLSDGRQTIEEQDKNGNVVSREGINSEGNRIWEDQFTNGRFSGREWYTENGLLYGWCENENCLNPETTFNWNREGCQYDDPRCYSFTDESTTAPEQFQDAIYDEQLWSGGLDWQEWTRAIFGMGTSTFPLTNEWDWYRETFIEGVDRFFAENYLGVEYFVSGMCTDWTDIVQNDGYAAIQTPHGLQSVGHIAAERISVGALLCNEEEECPDNLECKDDQFCYEPGKNEPKEGYLYKIDWSVIAPRDEADIAYGGGTGQGINFNLKIYNEESLYLFADERGRANANTIELEKGKSSSAEFAPLITEYSSRDFNKVCIEFGDKKPQALDGEEIKEICEDKIALAQPGRVPAEASDPSGVSRAAGVHYCGLNGCS